MPVPDLYEADFFAWTEQQAAVLRDLARSRRDLPNALDLDHVAEEIEDMGRSELATVKSLIRNILVHCIKFAAQPDAPARAHWRKEIWAFHSVVEDRYAPAMRQRIDLPRLWSQARVLAEADLTAYGEVEPDFVPQTCPIPLGMLLADPPDIEALAELLTGARGPSVPEK